MGLLAEFKEFAMKGNVIDLAVGVIIGTAFGRIVNSVVEDIIMPPIGLIVGGVDFRDLAVELGTNPAGEPVLFRYGQFIQTVFEFLIIAAALFAVIKAINRLKRQPEPKPAPPPPPSQTEVLLTEIRDLLARR
ncbi:MAG: large-conductance mechanosensitive channel protein MscL [Pseudomonadota bacterium]|jgi:large conductance mechanosensitive channel protein|nr:MAG: large conductance mechanosensitive channel protein MscL [Pseudomonadota bacterium]